MTGYPVYAKVNGMNRYGAFDVSEGALVGNKIYQSWIDNTRENQIKLQRIADDNKEIGLKFQFRKADYKTVVFETK